MMNKFLRLTCLGFLLAQTAMASVEVPPDLRNPFEIASASSFKPPAPKLPPKEEAPKVNPAHVQLDASFDRAVGKLKQLPVRGVIASPGNPKGNTLLMGTYVIKADTQLPSQDFGFNGLIKVLSVTKDQMVVEISIDLETRSFTIPLTR